MKTILITGGAGFVGSNLCVRLLDEGNRIICVDNFLTSSKENINPFLGNSNFKFIEHDIINPLFIDESIDEIYNLACPASPVHYQNNAIRTIKANTVGVINILGLARAKNAKIFQASTSEVYGDPIEHPQKESYRGNVNVLGLRSCYDEGKRCAETLCMDYHRQNKVAIRIVRIFNTYGSNMHPDDGRVVSNFIIQALKNEPLTIFGSGEQTRSFQYIDDLIEGMIRMMNNEGGFEGPVNLGNPQEVSIKELAELTLRLIPESASQIVYQPLPSDDPRRRKPDIALASEKLGWQPQTTLADGLVKTIEYFRKKICA